MHLLPALINQQNKAGETPLYRLAFTYSPTDSKAHIAAARLLNAGARTDLCASYNSCHMSPLDMAILTENLQMGRLLLVAGAKASPSVANCKHYRNKFIHAYVVRRAQVKLKEVSELLWATGQLHSQSHVDFVELLHNKERLAGMTFSVECIKYFKKRTEKRKKETVI